MTVTNYDTIKTSELINKLVQQVCLHGDLPVIVDYDCRRITDVNYDEADLEYDCYGWLEIETKEEENHRKYYRSLCWRKCQHEELNQRLNIRTTETGGRFLIVDGYEIDIDALLELPKEKSTAQ